MDENERYQKWNTFYNALDPLGKTFADQIVGLSSISKELSFFLFERGQLYGLVLWLMIDKLGIYDIDIDLDTLQSFNEYMLVQGPHPEKKDVLSIHIEPPKFNDDENN